MGGGRALEMQLARFPIMILNPDSISHIYSVRLCAHMQTENNLGLSGFPLKSQNHTEAGIKIGEACKQETGQILASSHIINKTISVQGTGKSKNITSLPPPHPILYKEKPDSST